MISKCANPSCKSSFRYFRGGKLFLVDQHTSTLVHEHGFGEQEHEKEYFWLYATCASGMTLTRDHRGRPRLKFIPHTELMAS